MVIFLFLLVVALVLVVEVSSYINSIKSYAQYQSITNLILSLPFFISTNINNNSNSNTISVLCPGYKIPIECYNTLINTIASSVSSDSITYNSNTIDNNDSITTDVLNLKNILSSSSVSSYKNIVVLSHSRGAAVALSSLLSIHSRINKIVVLIDPVDDSDNTAINIIRKSGNIKNINILILSLPYGGYSKYYKTYYESSCAPSGRNSFSFLDALSYANIPTSSVTYRGFGHFALLDDDEIKKLPIGNVCSSYDPSLSIILIDQMKQSSYLTIKDFIVENSK